MPPKKRKGSQKPVQAAEDEKVETLTTGSSENAQEIKDKKVLKETKKPERANKRKQKDDENGTATGSSQIDEEDELTTEPVKRVRGVQRKKKDVKPENSENEEKAVTRSRRGIVKNADANEPTQVPRKRQNDQKTVTTKAKKSKVPIGKNQEDETDEIVTTGDNAEAIVENHEEGKKPNRRGKKVLEEEHVPQKKIRKGKGEKALKEKENGQTAKPVRGGKETAKVEKPKSSRGKNKKNDDQIVSEDEQQLVEEAIVPDEKKVVRLTKKVVATKVKRGKRISK